MKKSISPLIFGLGIACMACGIYWIFNGGELTEIILAFIIGIGVIGSAFYKSTNKSDDSN